MNLLSLPPACIALVVTILMTRCQATSSLAASGSSISFENSSATSNTTWAGQSILSAATTIPTKSSSAGVGDYIASGLGLSSSTPSSFSSTTVTTSRHASANISSSILPNATITASAELGNSTSLSNTTFSNTTLGVCYDQWMSYWNASSSYQGNSTVTVFPTSTTTTWSGLTTQTDAWTVTGGTYTTTYDLTQTLTISAGAFNYSIITETYSGVQTYTVTGSSSVGTTTWTAYSDAESTATVPQVITITPPPCALPSVVPQCQSSWMSFLSASTDYNPPVCQNVAVDSDLCQSFQDKYVIDYKWFDSAQFDGYSKGYTQNPDWVVDGVAVTGGIQQWIWPTWSTLAPSCTLGCARCGITGGHVQLMYWPPNTTYNTATGPVTMSVDDTTLTYPTVYISYYAVSASDSCKAVGPTISNTIVAITNSADISSIYAQPTEGADFNVIAGNVVRTEVASFDIRDLQDTPASIFSRQIWCVSLMSLHAAGYENGTYYTVPSDGAFGGRIPVQYSCPTTLPYNPILYLPSQVLQSMNSDWATCSGDINGVYDPPTALHPQASTDGVTTPKALTTTPASPSSPVQAPTVSATPTVATFQATTTGQPVVGSGAGPSRTSGAAQTPSTVQSGSSDSSTSNPQQPIGTAIVGGQNGASSNQESAASQSSNDIDPSVLISIASQVGQSSINNDPPAATTTTNALSILQSAADSAGTTMQAGGNAASSRQSSSNAALGDEDPDSSKTVVAQPVVISVGTQAVTVDSADPSHIVVQNGGFSATLAVGGAATTVNGLAISAAPSGNVVVSGSSEQSGVVLNGPAPSDPIATSVVIAGQTFVASSADPSHVVLQNSATALTLAAGGAATVINGQLLSAAPSGILVLSGPAGHSTVGVGTSTPRILTPSTITIGSQVHVASSPDTSHVVVQNDGSSTTLTAGGSAITVDGQVLSAAPSGHLILSGSAGLSTVELGATSPGTLAAIATAQDGRVISMVASSGTLHVQEGTTTFDVAAGQTTVINGQTIGAGPGASQAVLNGTQTIKLSSQTNIDPVDPTPATTVKASNGAILSLATLRSGIEVWDGSTTTTLSAGAAITIDGQTISVARSGEGVVIMGTSTITLNSGRATPIGLVGSTTTSQSSIGVSATKSASRPTTSASSIKVSLVAERQAPHVIVCLAVLGLTALVIAR